MASGTRVSLANAAKLGRQAAKAGLQSKDLAKIHEKALISLVVPSDFRTSSNGTNGKLARAVSFFIEALTPIEDNHHAAVGKTSHLGRLNGSMREHSVELASTKRALKRELVRRKTLETALLKSRHLYEVLLKRSDGMQRHLRRLSHEILAAQEAERKRISRELHDEIGQTLTAINVRLASLKHEAALSTTTLAKKISSTQRLVERSMQVVHRFARELRPALLDDLGLIPALHAQLRVFTKRTHVPVTFKTVAVVEQLDSDSRTVLYRVAQEAFANIAKHAHASSASVVIKRIAGFIRMEIHDNGNGFDVNRVVVESKTIRLGLLGMRERVEMVGGTFEIESAPGQGTTIRARIPLGEPK